VIREFPFAFKEVAQAPKIQLSMATDATVIKEDVVLLERGPEDAMRLADSLKDPNIEDVQYKEWKRLMLSGLKDLIHQRHAIIFTQPVTEEEAPNYYSIILKPTCLQKIKQQVRDDQLRTTDAVYHVLLVLFYNAIVYNGPDTVVYEMAVEMRQQMQRMIYQIRKKTEEMNAKYAESMNDLTMQLYDGGHILNAPLFEESPRKRQKRGFL
jgi:Bromodomain